MNKKEIFEALVEVQKECEKYNSEGIVTEGKVFLPSKNALPRLSPCTECPYNIEIKENTYMCRFTHNPSWWNLDDYRKD